MNAETALHIGRAYMSLEKEIRHSVLGFYNEYLVPMHKHELMQMIVKLREMREEMKKNVREGYMFPPDEVTRSNYIALLEDD